VSNNFYNIFCIGRCIFFFFFFFDKEGDYALDKKIGLTRGTIAGWRSGRCKPSVDALVKVALHLRVSTDVLLGLAPPPPNLLSRLSDNEQKEVLRLFNENVKNHKVLQNSSLATSTAPPDLQHIIDAWPTLTSTQKHFIDKYLETSQAIHKDEIKTKGAKQA